MVDSRYVNYLGQALPASATPTNVLVGTAGGETIIGTDAADSINGKGGLDTLAGGLGDDTYYVNAPYVSIAKPTIIEAAGQGIDTVRTQANFMLPDNVENLFVSGYTGYSGTTGIGNSGDNVIIGDSLAQTLDGRAGNDVLTGGGGGDTFVFQAGSGHDVITDFFAGSKPAVVALQDYAFKSFDSIRAAMTQVGKDVILTLSPTDDVTFRNATIAQFTASSFYTPLDLSGMKMTFSDEFNASSIDLFNKATGTGTWSTDFGYVDPDAKLDRSYGDLTGEREIYVDPDYRGLGNASLNLNPFSLNNGILGITASVTPDALKSSLYNYPYTSGLLSTRASMSQLYGYFEIRAKLPSTAGAWPAFWLYGSSSTTPSEIDVFEGSSNAPGIPRETVHDASLSTPVVAGPYVPDSDTAFHTYGVMWTADTITFYIDGRETSQVATPADMHRPMYLMVNLAVGGSGGTPDPTQYPSAFEVDYIRAYSLPATMTADPTDLRGTANTDVLQTTAATLTMTGLSGDDTYIVDHSGVTINEAINGGHDTVKTSLLQYTLPANVEDLTYTGSFAFIGNGNALNNVITGGPEADQLNGGAGADTLIGGAGNDTYYVDNANDSVIEQIGGGTDTVYSSARSYQLTAGQEIETLRAAGPLATVLIGNEFNNVIIGNSNNNVLDGRGGINRLEGMGGNDTYYVSAGDFVVERPNDGTDTIITTANNYSLPANVENLTFAGTGDFVGSGNSLANVIIGGAGNDTISSGGGADQLRGGLGNDTYVVDGTAATIVELPGQGYDVLRTSLTAAVAPANVEELDYTGSDRFSGYANAQGTKIVGGPNADYLGGGSGSDILVGGGGADIMRGGAGADVFVFNNVGSGVVRIIDFEAGVDHLQFDATAAGVAPGDVTVQQGLAAYVPDQHPAIIVDARTVYIDLHGDGQSVVALATFDTTVSLHQSDFLFT